MTAPPGRVVPPVAVVALAQIAAADLVLLSGCSHAKARVIASHTLRRKALAHTRLATADSMRRDRVLWGDEGSMS